jgi:hypothetical protein
MTRDAVPDDDSPAADPALADEVARALDRVLRRE